MKINNKHASDKSESVTDINYNSVQRKQRMSPLAGTNPVSGKSKHTPVYIVSKKDDRVPMQAAKGDDDLMSQKQK